MKINSILSAEELRLLIQASDFQGFRAVFTSWLMIAGCFWLVASFPNPVTVAFALVVLGGRHLAIAILMHDCAHYSLFKTRWLNDFIGSWFCAYPTWQDLKRYRVHHLSHHKYAGTEKDPDASLVKPFPVSRKSMIRKFIRDIFGVSGLKRIYGLVLMDFGYIKYTVANDIVPIDQKGRSFWNIVKTGIQNLHGVVLTNTILFLILWAWGHPWLYSLWIVSYLTTFSVFVRIRSLAEHAVTEMGLDPFKSTRTTLAHWWDRVTVAPHRVNYHLEHHLMMTVPYFRLPKLHQILEDRGALKNAFVAHGYREVLKLAVRNK